MMTVNDLIKNTDLTAVNLADGDREITGGYAGDLLSWVMGRAEENCAWVTIMSNSNIIAVAALADVSCVVLAEGVKLEPEVISTAKEKNINILSSQADIFNTSALIYNLLK